MLFVLFSLFGLTLSQPINNCVYRFGGLELDLLTIKGQELNYKGNDAVYHYSVCETGLQCERNSINTPAMVDVHRDGINECLYLAQMNDTLLPFYDFAIGSWIFNYSNGAPCPDQTQQLNHSVTIAWTCNEDYTYAHISDVYHYDACNDFMMVEWEGACNPAPPPNEHCEFRSGFQFLNLSSLQGVKLNKTDQYGNSWEFTPCSNGLKCLTGRGSTLDVMSEVADPTGQCIKYFGVWSGDSLPFYDRTIFGQDYWDFFWANGEECGDGGPAEILNVRYYCNQTVNGAVIREAKGAGGPCQFRFEIDTPLACSGNDKNNYKDEEIVGLKKYDAKYKKLLKKAWKGLKEEGKKFEKEAEEFFF